MASDLAASFLPNLVDWTAACLQSPGAAKTREIGRVVRAQSIALQGAHDRLCTGVGLIRAELAALEAGGNAPNTDTTALAQALASFRAQRREVVSWLDLYCTTSSAIEAIAARTTKSLNRLTDQQADDVSTFVHAACGYLEVSYNRDFDAAGMAVTCDRLVETGVRSEADAFRVATLGQRFAAAEQDVATSGARWATTFEAMASRLECQAEQDQRPRSLDATADWLTRFGIGPARRLPPPSAAAGSACN